MEGSVLRLIVEKGPREGETLDCGSRSVIRIGRVVKGNTFCIKDAGISSKHLVIELKDGKWLVSDLDTSNGTLLNGVSLQPMSGYYLRDEDVIKIGELTSLKVKIFAPDIVAEDEKSCLRRNPKRAAAGRTRAAKEEASSDVALLQIPEVGRTENVTSVAEEKPRRRGRAVRSREIVDHVAKKQTTRRGRKEDIVKLQKITEAESCLEEGLKNKKASVSVSGATNVPEDLNSEQESCRETKDMDQVQKRVSGLDITEKNSTLQEESIARPVKNSTVTNVETDASRPVDLEKMTLGEWFDYMEVYLPKQIHEATEEIISSIRERSKQFNEFIQQRDLKGKFQTPCLI